MQFHHWAELSAWITGCLLVKAAWPAPFKWLVVLAGLSFSVELAGHIMWTQYRLFNNWLYNIFLPIQCILFLYFFYAVALHPTVKKALKVLFVLMAVGQLVAYINHKNFSVLNSYASTLFLFLMLLASCLFYLDAILNNLEISLLKQPAFYIGAGVLFFTVIFILLFAFWAVNISIPHYRQVLKYSIIVANTFLYGGLIAGFVCLNKTKNYYSHFLQDA
jgi:hypothetical protein